MACLGANAALFCKIAIILCMLRSNFSCFLSGADLQKRQLAWIQQYNQRLLSGYLLILLYKLFSWSARCIQWIENKWDSFFQYWNSKYSYESTRKTWNTDFMIIVCQNLICLYSWLHIEPISDIFCVYMAWILI